MSEEALTIDGYDDAVIGMASVWQKNERVDTWVYSGKKMVDILMKDGMSRQDAMEYIEFNIEGAYVGPSTPIIVWESPLP